MNLHSLSFFLLVKLSLGFNLPSRTRTVAGIQNQLFKQRTKQFGLRNVLSVSNRILPPAVLFQLNAEKEIIDVGDDGEDAKVSSAAIETKASSQSSSKLTARIAKIYDNLNSGEFGKRGETYFAIQALLVVCILYGNIPLLGELITFILGPCLVILGIGLLVLGVKDLGPNLSPWPKVPEGSSLVKEGVFAELRHPIYAGLLYFCLGLSMWTGSAMRVLLTGALWYLLEKKSDYEERFLIDQFDDYEEYRSDVGGKFVPERLMEAMPWVESD
jgi:protein-S-isoprenylcysteine O-methyltransferase Ste14